MRVLVTGGAGYIGSHTCKALVAAGHIPIVFDNFSTGHRSLVQFGKAIYGDIGDVTALRRAIRDAEPDAVIHFAASAYVGESMTQPRQYYRNNITGTLNLLDAITEAGISKLVFSSSCATYGIPKTVPIKETERQLPINPYGESKLVCEQMMRSIVAAENLNCIALRYFNASGADPDGQIGELHDPETHVIPLLLMALAGHREKFTIMGDDYPTPDGTCIRDYLHVTDLADGHVKALDKLTASAGFEAFNLGTGDGKSVQDLVTAAQTVTGRQLNAHRSERRPGDPPALVADSSKAMEQLGWTPEHSSIENIIDSAWKWMHQKNNPFFSFSGY